MLAIVLCSHDFEGLSLTRRLRRTFHPETVVEKPCLSVFHWSSVIAPIRLRFPTMAYSNSSAARPEHARLTSSAYLLGSERRVSAKSYEDIDTDRGYGEIGNGRPGRRSQDGEEGGHESFEPLAGMEAVRLGSSFFVFGMLIGELVAKGSRRQNSVLTFER